MSLKNKEHIFQSTSQRVDHIDISTIRLLADRCLIRDLGNPTESNGIVIPETCQDSRAQQEWGDLRIGLVLAVGPGDAYIENGVTDDGQVLRKAILSSDLCPVCMGRAAFFDMQAYEKVDCPECYGYGKWPVTVPPQCSVGDKVLYSVRREAEFVVNGERLSLIFAEQSVVAVIE